MQIKLVCVCFIIRYFDDVSRLFQYINPVFPTYTVCRMLSHRGIMQLLGVNIMIHGGLLLCALPSKSRAASRCCASARSFTVVVLMRDESGYMMLLPFHQQRKPPKPEQTQKWYRGISLSQPRRHPLSSGARNREQRPARSLFAAPSESARSVFSGCTCTWMRFLLSALDRAWD